MADHTLDLVVSLDAGENVSQEMLHRLARQVYQDLNRTEADAVKWAESAEVPEGAKGIPLDINTIIVSLASAGAITAIIQFLKDWSLRAEGRTVKIKTQIGDNSVELEYSPTATSEEELTAFAEKLIQILNKPQIERP
jgi:hypothetical protein